MSDDDYHEQLMDEDFQRNRDSYLQKLIEFLEDPDYEDTPIVIDNINFIYPEGINMLMLIKHIQNLVDRLKENYFK